MKEDKYDKDRENDKGLRRAERRNFDGKADKEVKDSMFQINRADRLYDKNGITVSSNITGEISKIRKRKRV